MKIKQADIAETLGITAARVTQLKGKGMPVNSIDAAAAWYRANVDQKLSPKLTPSKAPPPAARSMEEVASVVYDLQDARAKRETHEANLAELKERQMLGELVEADRVRRAVTSLAAGVRSAFERIPDKLAERLAATSDAQSCHVLLTTEIDLVLADLAAGARNLKMEGDGRA